VSDDEGNLSLGRGRVTREATYWCGLCVHWDQQPFQWRLDRVMRKNGWRMTRDHGWVCPKCAVRIGKAPEKKE